MNTVPETLKKRLLLAGVVSILLGLTAVVLEHMPGEPKRSMERPSPGSLPLTETFVVEVEGEPEEFSVQIGALEYTKEQIERLQLQTEQWLRQVVPGANESLDVITEDLVFPSRAVTTNGTISWSTDAPWLIRSDGTVCNETVEEPVIVEITAKVSYGSEIRVFTCLGTVHKKQWTEKEQQIKKLKEQLEQEEKASRTETTFRIPEQLLGMDYTWKEKKTVGLSAFLFLVAFILPVFVYVNFFNTEEEKRKERKQDAENGYVEFITKLSLMMAAGITVRQCFGRLAEEYERDYGEGHVLTRELKRAKQALEHGHSEGKVYEDFGKRCEVLAYQRTASLLIQNSSKGIQGIGALLVQEAKEAMAQERAGIRVRGEQAGTKLLFPMMGLLFLVFAILLMPAFQSF